MIEHRHAKQLHRGDHAGEGREPEIQPQRREDDEDEIGHRRHEAERCHRSHAVDMQRQRDRRHRGFDQRADIAPDHGQIAAVPHMAGDLAMHPQLEQDERHDDRVEIFRLQIAVPDAAHRLGCEEIDCAEDDGEQCGGCDQSLDAQKFGRHHFLHQRALEVGRHPRVLPFVFLPENLTAFFLCHSGMVRRTRPGISRFRVRLFEAPRNDREIYTLNRACDGSASRRSSSPAASVQ